MRTDPGRTLHFSIQNVHVAKVFHESSLVDARVGIDIKSIGFHS